MFLAILLTGNDNYAYKWVAGKSVAHYVGDNPNRIDWTAKAARLLHYILSKFFPLSAVSSAGEAKKWGADPHFDEASYNMMFNIMHNTNSPDMENQMALDMHKKANHDTSPERLFTFPSNCGVQVNPKLYDQF